MRHQCEIYNTTRRSAHTMAVIAHESVHRLIPRKNMKIFGEESRRSCDEPWSISYAREVVSYGSKKVGFVLRSLVCMGGNTHSFISRGFPLPHYLRWFRFMPVFSCSFRSPAFPCPHQPGGQQVLRIADVSASNNHGAVTTSDQSAWCPRGAAQWAIPVSIVSSCLYYPADFRLVMDID